MTMRASHDERVIDTHGNVVFIRRMTGATGFSLELSERKAYTSALVGIRTADLVPLVRPGAELYPLLAVPAADTPRWAAACHSRAPARSSPASESAAERRSRTLPSSRQR
jgi:Haem-degrading